MELEPDNGAVLGGEGNSTCKSQTESLHENPSCWDFWGIGTRRLQSGMVHAKSPRSWHDNAAGEIWDGEGQLRARDLRGKHRGAETGAVITNGFFSGLLCLRALRPGTDPHA